MLNFHADPDLHRVTYADRKSRFKHVIWAKAAGTGMRRSRFKLRDADGDLIDARVTRTRFSTDGEAALVADALLARYGLPPGRRAHHAAGSLQHTAARPEEHQLPRCVHLGRSAVWWLVGVCAQRRERGRERPTLRRRARRGVGAPAEHPAVSTVLADLCADMRGTDQ